MRQFMGLQGIGHDWVTELNWTKTKNYRSRKKKKKRIWASTSNHIQKSTQVEQKINVRAKIIKLLEENIDVNLHYLGLKSIFLII